MKMPEYVVVKIMPDKKGTSYSLEVVADTDFVNVVRCKDCRKNPKISMVGCPMACLKTWTEDGFCFKGEKVTE